MDRVTLNVDREDVEAAIRQLHGALYNDLLIQHHDSAAGRCRMTHGVVLQEIERLVQMLQGASADEAEHRAESAWSSGDEAENVRRARELQQVLETPEHPR